MSTKLRENKLRPGVLLFLLFTGTLQMAGDLTGMASLKALGAATSASPAPKVFTAQEGFETYSSNFYLEWTDNSGVEQSLHITPEVYYHGIRGPYNRRNAYGAALSYGPVLYANPATRPMFESVFSHALCGEAPMLKETGIDPSRTRGEIRIRIVPRQQLPENHHWKLTHETKCN